MATTIIAGSTSNRLRFLLGTTGLTNSSAGLVISTINDNEASATVYTAAAGNIETITTLGTYAAPTTGRCRFREVDPTNHPGLYEIQLPDARFAVANSSRLVVSVLGAAGLPSNGVHYEVDLRADADVKTWRGTQPATLQSGRVDSFVGVNNDKTGYFLNPETGLGNQIANITGSIGSVGSSVTVGSIASNAINAAALATDAVSEIVAAVFANGSWTSTVANINDIHSDVNEISLLVVANLNAPISTMLPATSYVPPLSAAGTRSAIGLASANLDAQFNALAGFVDNEVALIKAKTDQLTFTVPGQVDANSLTGGLSEAQVRSAVGLASANLDSQLSAIASGNDAQIVISPAAILQNEHFKTTPYNPNPLFVPFKAQKTFSIGIYTLSASGEKVAVNMESKILRVVFENASGGDVGVLENASINKLGNTVTFTSPASAATPPNSARKMMGKWSLREVANDFAWAWGGWEVIDVAYKDT